MFPLADFSSIHQRLFYHRALLELPQSRQLSHKLQTHIPARFIALKRCSGTSVPYYSNVKGVSPMLKRISFYAVSVFITVSFMTAGCAKQNIVKKDEGIVPVEVSRMPGSPVKSTDSVNVVTSPEPTVSQSTQVSYQRPTVTQQSTTVQQSQKASSVHELHSALEKIYFDFDSSNLSDLSRRTLAKNAESLSNETTGNIRIEGNCDERGSAEYNLALGERRACHFSRAFTHLVFTPIHPGTAC